MAGIRIGKFQVVGNLGTGAHSSILHVRRSADSKSYALKVVPINGAQDIKFLEQARHEYEVAQKLDHPNLVKIYALELQRNVLFRVRKVQLLIEYVNGPTLDLAPKLRLPQLVQVFVQVAAGLVHMHRRGVCHADLKPNNILLSKSGQVKIIDFGLAWIKGQQKGRVQGTPEYMAPEQSKHGFVNERTDIYNFGATMYRLVTGNLPPPTVAEAGGLQMKAKIFEQQLKPVKDCVPKAPEQLCDVIHRCMAFDAQRRPERVSEVQGVLDHLADKMVRSPEDRLEAIEW